MLQMLAQKMCILLINTFKGTSNNASS